MGGLGRPLAVALEVGWTSAVPLGWNPGEPLALCRSSFRSPERLPVRARGKPRHGPGSPPVHGPPFWRLSSHV